jgi:hypothetical protein
MLIFCFFLSACNSGKVKVLDATAQLHSTLAAALEGREVSCDFQLSKKISKGEWRLEFAFFKEGKLINEDDDSFEPSMFGGCIGTPMSIKEQGKRKFIPDNKIKFDNINVKLFFIDLEYVNLNEKIKNKKQYKAFLSVKADNIDFSETILIPKSVLDLRGVDIGTFPKDFAYPDNIIPIFYLREMDFWEEWEITEDSLPSPKNNLKEFIVAKHPGTMIICFLAKDLEAWLDFLDKYHLDP